MGRNENTEEKKEDYMEGIKKRRIKELMIGGREGWTKDKKKDRKHTKPVYVSKLT
jgi:hypothetical protein